MMEDRNTVQYHLGCLTGQVRAFKDTLESLAEVVGENAALTAGLVEAVNRLPCSERLESCKRERDAISKRLNNQGEQRRSRSARWWALLVALLGAIVVGIVDFIAHFVWT